MDKLNKILHLLILWHMNFGPVQSAETARYNFAKYHGQLFKDISGNGLDALNGNSLAYESLNDMWWIQDRGLYSAANDKQFVQTPQHAEITDDLQLTTDFTASFIVKMFGTGFIYSKYYNGDILLALGLTDSGGNTYLTVYTFVGGVQQSASRLHSSIAYDGTWKQMGCAMKVWGTGLQLSLVVENAHIDTVSYTSASFDDTTDNPSVYPSYPGKFGLIDASRTDQFYGFIASGVFLDEYPHSISLENQYVTKAGLSDLAWDRALDNTGCACINEVFRWWYDDANNCNPCDGCSADVHAFCENIDNTSSLCKMSTGWQVDCNECSPDTNTCYNCKAPTATEELDGTCLCPDPGGYFDTSTELCDNCAAGQVYNTVTSLCEVEACDDTCDTWSGSGAGDCLLCPSNSHRRDSVAATSECDCDDQKYRSGGDPGKCDADCHNCKECNGPNPDDCTMCYDSQTFNGGLCECAAQEFWDTSPTNPVWAVCADTHENKCLLCADQDFVWNSVTTTCEVLVWDTTWDTWNGTDANECLTCVAGEYLQLDGAGPQGSCHACDNRCATCDDAGISNCTSCITNAEFRSAANPEACDCSTDFYWKRCNGYDTLPCNEECLARPASCTPGSLCEDCDGFMAMSNNCTDCNFMWKKWNGDRWNWTDCYDNASLTVHPSNAAKQTWVWDDGYYPNPGVDACTPCPDNTCKTCNATECLSCYTNASIFQSGGNPDTCQCDTGYYLDGSNCNQWDPSCLTCSGQLVTECVICHTDVEIETLTGRWICSYPPGTSQYSTGEGSCPAPACDASCLTCDAAGGNYSDCTDCHPNATLQVTVCQCESGFYPDTGVDTCSEWGRRCATCAAGGDSSWDTWVANASKLTGAAQDQCDCDENYFWDRPDWRQWAVACKVWLGAAPNQCNECVTNATQDAGNVCSCDAGYADSPTDTLCHLCKPSSAVPICKKCDIGDLNQCTECYDNAIIDGQDWVCASGFHPDTGVDNCQPCGQRCATCAAAGDSQWDSWVANSSKLTGAAQDQCDCDETYFWTGTIWDQCSIACKVWVGGVPNQCTECVTNATQDISNVCSCDDGYVENPADSLCHLCKPSSTDPICKKCDIGDLDQCTECYDNAIINGQDWVCASGFYPDTGVDNCQPCGLRCATCAAGGDSQWDSWVANASKLTGAAQDQCDCDETLFWTGSIWDQCSIACKVWVGGAPNQCTECVTNATQDAGNVCSCDDGYVDSPTDRLCHLCKPASTDPICKKCDIGDLTQCTECYENAIIDGQDWVCASGFYPDTGVDNCQPCGQVCATCTTGGDTQWDTCVLNATKLTGSPQDSCHCDDTYFWDGTQWDQCSIACKVWDGGAANQCTECVDNASFNTANECACNDGYVENPADGSCSSCKPDTAFPMCKKCDQSNLNQCTECYDNAIIVSAQWTCDSGYAGAAIGALVDLTHDATNCEPCDGAWDTCAVNDKNDCQSCVANAALSNSACTCDDGFTLQGNACVVVACHSTCDTCIGSGDTQCNTCKANATLNNGSCVCNDNFLMSSTGNCSPGCHNNAQLVNSVCECRDGFFPNPDEKSCAACDSSCKTCINNSSWETCPANAYIVDSGLWVSCTDQTFYDSTQAVCLPWLPFWATCFDENSCETCADTSVQYTQGECCGDQHFRDTSLQCQQCSTLCQQCSSIETCTSCVDKAVLISNVCECEVGYHIFEEGCAEDGEAPQLSIGVVSSNKVQLSFDKQILQQLSISNTEVVLEGIDPDLYTYQMIEVEPGLTWEIVFDFADSVELNNTTVDILFREKITDLNGNANDESEYEAQLPDQPAADGSSSTSDSSDENLDAQEEAMVDSSTTAVQSIIFAGILSGYVTGDLTSTWGFINTIQILAFIPLMDSQMPQLIKKTLTGLLEFELIPNLFELVLDEDEFVQQEPYDLAQEYGFDNNVFLINWGGILVNAFMILMLIPIMLLLGKCKNAKIAAFAQKSVFSYKWCFFLRVWIELHLEVGLAAYFQFMTPYWDNGTMIANMLLGNLAFVLTFLSFPFILLFMVRNRRLIQERDELFYKIYGSLFDEFKNSMGTVSTLFYSWFFLRRTIYILTLILLRDYVGYQLMINLMHTTLTLLFLIIYRPFISASNTYFQIYCEIVTGALFSLCACFHLQGARENSETIKWTVLTLIMSIVLINLILTFVTQFILLTAMCKKACRKRTARVEDVRDGPIKGTKSITSITFEETEPSQPYPKSEEILRSKEEVAMSVARKLRLANQAVPDYIKFERPNPGASTPIIDQESISSPEVEEADLDNQEAALDQKLYKATMAHQVARRLRSSYGAQPAYVKFARVGPGLSFQITNHERIGSMDMDETIQPQEQQSPSDSSAQSKEDAARVVSRTVQESYSTKPDYVNFERSFHGRSNHG